MIQEVLKLVRVTHWIKNLAILLPVFFSGQFIDILNSPNFSQVFYLFLSFCLASSIIYIINDSVDVEKDKLHPIKKNRPIASGSISINQALLIGVLLLVVLGINLYLIGEVKWFVIGYFILNILYSFKLKNIAIIDVTCISIGFIIRILAGGYLFGIEVSQWMIIIVFLLSISIAFAKRRDDITLGKDKLLFRKSQNGYTTEFIDIATGICFSITLVAYIMYSVSEEVLNRIGTDKLYLTSLFVFIGILRYLQITIVENASGSPIRLIGKDIFLQLSLLAWISFFAYFLYF